MGPSAKAEQKERKALAGSTGTTTYFRQAQIAEALEVGGRYAVEKDITVGVEQAVNYPAGPAWTRDQVGLEPPLGASVDDMQPCGEAFEVERSLLVAPVVTAAHDGPPAVAILPQPAERKAPSSLSSSSDDGASSNPTKDRGPYRGPA
jgi:hypothetical protein